MHRQVGSTARNHEESDNYRLANGSTDKQRELDKKKADKQVRTTKRARNIKSNWQEYTNRLYIQT